MTMLCPPLMLGSISRFTNDYTLSTSDIGFYKGICFTLMVDLNTKDNRNPCPNIFEGVGRRVQKIGPDYHSRIQKGVKYASYWN
jgi:hypothetical protein